MPPKNYLSSYRIEEMRVDGEKLMALVSSTPGAQFTPAGVLRLPVDGGGTPAAVLGFIAGEPIAPLTSLVAVRLILRVATIRPERGRGFPKAVSVEPDGRVISERDDR